MTPPPSCSTSLRLVDMPDAQDVAVRGLLDLAADSAPDVAAHMERTGRLATSLVRSLELCEPLARIVVLTARLHDIGKLGIPPWVLEKPGPLSKLESRMMREHSVLGQRMLELHECAGTQFDPGVAAAFRELLEGRFDQLAQGA